MQLTYDAIDTRGQRVHDVLQAASVKEGVESLRRQGLFVTHIAQSKESAAPRSALENRGGNSADVRLSLGALVLFTRQMSMLLTSGSAVVPALAAIAAQMKSEAQKKMVARIREDLERGEPLAESLGRFPRAFDASYCAVVAAGESSATLPKMFARLAVLIGKRRAMRNKFVGALIYPALLTVMSVGILGVMLFFVVPRFANMFKMLGVELPGTTRVILYIADGIRHGWMFLVIGAAGVIVGLISLLRTDGGRQFLSDVQIRIPLAGRLMSRLIQAQTFRILGMLIETRVALLEALQLARRVTRNRAFQAFYDDLEESVSKGNSIHGAFERSGLIGPSIIQAVRTGEHSGRLGESISYVADVLDEENSELLAVLTKIIEPLVLIGMGVIVGFVAVSLFMPLFDMTAAV